MRPGVLHKRSGPILQHLDAARLVPPEDLRPSRSTAPISLWRLGAITVTAARSFWKREPASQGSKARLEPGLSLRTFWQRNDGSTRPGSLVSKRRLDMPEQASP